MQIAEILHVKRSTAASILREAYELGWFSKTQIRRRSYKNFKEYVSFLTCENPIRSFSELVNKENIIYHATTGGPTNFWVVSGKELDINCGKVVSGLRSDYHVSFAPNHSWETAIQKMQKMVEDFNPKEYEPEGIIKTHWDETVEWDSEYEILFNEFNYDLSKPISPLMVKHCISWGKVDTWMKNLSKYYTVFTLYYPGKISSYDPYLFRIKTDCEDFIINLFSELPTSTLFFRVADTLFINAHVRREYMRVVESQTHINRLQIPNLTLSLLERGIIRSETHGIVECYWNKDP